MNTLKILKKLVSEGYSLKAHHNNNQWKEALENGELLIQELSKLHQPTVIKSVCDCDVKGAYEEWTVHMCKKCDKEQI
jgi:tRNA(Ile)-lysidine synthase TilS/MesJ